ncbi:hypothetical protein [Shewanella putrefaciens]|uniref:hypothetical protein n=1 Tax=Shewanella putrefaciens TaxID=24 RepID=UPI003D7AD1EE
MNFGKFKITVNAGTDKEVVLDWQDNLVLKDLFNTTSNASSIALHFGTGTTPPLTTDTQLANKLATYFSLSTTSFYGPNKTKNIRTGDVFTLTHVYKFEGTAGAIRGNVSELGLYYVNKYFTRALIKDGNGNPTTLTLKETDILTVEYMIGWTIDVSVPLAVKTFTFDGVETTATLSWCNTAHPSNFQLPFKEYLTDTQVYVHPRLWNFADSSIWLNQTLIYSGSLTNKANVASNSLTAISTTGFNFTRTPSNGAMVITASVSAAAGVATGTWSGALIAGQNAPSISNANANMVLEFNPPLVKGALEAFTLNMTFEVGGSNL